MNGYKIIKHYKNSNSNKEKIIKNLLVIFTGIGPKCDCKTYNSNNEEISVIKYYKPNFDIICIQIDENILDNFYEKNNIIAEIISIEHHKNISRKIVFLTHSFGSIIALNVIKLIRNNSIKIIMIEPTNESLKETLFRKKISSNSLNYNKIFKYTNNISIVNNFIIDCKVLVIISFNKFSFYSILEKINSIKENSIFTNVDELKIFYSKHINKIDAIQKLINNRDTKNIHIITIPIEEKNPHFFYKNNQALIIEYMNTFI